MRDVLLAAGEGLRLAASGSSYASAGEYVSEVREAAILFDNAVLSWNVDAPEGTSVRFELRVRDGNGWSGWYGMGEWSGDGGRSIAGQADSRGRVDVDNLKLNSPATGLQYRARLATSSPGRTPLLRAVSVAYADLRRGLSGPLLERPNGGARDLDVPRHAQWLQDPSIASKICSPTSLAMLLQYWGLKKPVAEVAAGVRDRTTGIYGNWALNTAYAAANGFDARVDRLYSLQQIEQEIAAGRPVAISVTYNRGEMAGWPNKAAPSGHLMLVRGFTSEGDVIVNDPDAPSDQGVRVVYPRESLGRIWLRSGGIVYLVSPRQ